MHTSSGQRTKRAIRRQAQRLEKTLEGERTGTTTHVSVVMPVYNGERFVAEAIESVLGQTHRAFEFIIIDDGSTDSTPAILERYARSDSRIRHIAQENRDQPATLNRALSLATHDWVAVIDHDDVSLPNRLERELAWRERFPAARLIGSYAWEIDADGRRIGNRFEGPRTPDEYAAYLAASRTISLVHPSVLMHRQTILELGGYNPAFGGAADTELWSRVADNHVVLVVPEPLVLYRIHGQSMSYTRYYEQRLALRWLLARQSARRRGQPEPTLEQHLRSRRGPLGLGHLNQRRRDFVQLCLWRARLARVANQHHRAAIHLGQATIAAPLEMAGRAAGRLPLLRAHAPASALDSGYPPVEHATD